MRRTAWAVALSAASLSGCAVWSPKDDRSEAYDAFLAQRASLEAWSVAGRAALRAGGEAVSLSLQWEQEGPRYEIDLSGPFGAGGVRVSGTGNGVILETADGRAVRARTPADLLASQLGYRLPVRALRHWIVGRPSAAYEVAGRAVDRQGRLQELKQAGWVVTYRGWSEVEGVDMPSRIDLRSGDKRVRVVLSGWSLEDGG